MKPTASASPLPLSRTVRRVTLTACALLMLACAGKFLPRPGAAQAAYATRTGTPATVKSLQEGRDLMVSNCQGCHALPGIGEHSPEEWGPILDRMSNRAGLTPRQDSLVRAYVVSSAGWQRDSSVH